MEKNLQLMKRVLNVLKADETFTKSEREHVNRLFMVAGDVTTDELCELTDNLSTGNLPLLV